MCARAALQSACPCFVDLLVLTNRSCSGCGRMHSFDLGHHEHLNRARGVPGSLHGSGSLMTQKCRACRLSRCVWRPERARTFDSRRLPASAMRVKVAEIFFSPPWEPLRGEEIGFWYFFLIFFSRPFHTNSRDFRNAEKSEPVTGCQGLTLGGGPSHCNARGKCGVGASLWVVARRVSGP